MQPISQTSDKEGLMETNGHATTTTTTTTASPSQQDGINGKSVISKAVDPTPSQNGNVEKIALQNEMASMVPLQVLIGKMVNKTYADLQTLTDTLSSRGEVEKKRQILKYVTFVQNQMLKLSVLVKWAENADDIQMCQNIMAFLANQNQFFYDATRFLNKIHVELPRARIRNFDIPTAVDVLTTGSYQRMPSKYKDMVPRSPLTDEEVLETFRKMNDVIRMRMLTTEVLPSPMQHYRIESGRITFTIKDEFEVSLTLMGPPSEQRWWIVSLDIQVKSTVGSGAADVDISLNEIQRQYLRVNAQKQLVPPQPPQDEQTKTPLFFPLVNLHDYLHLFCLNMQLEIIYMQSTMVSKTRWLEQLKVQMDPTRNKLVLVYWKGGSPTAHWAHPQLELAGRPLENSTTIEISVVDEKSKRKGPYSDQINMAISVRDDMRGLVQRAGLGASAMLSSVDEEDKPAVVSALQYPKNQLEVLWGGFNNLHADKELLNPSDLNIERVLWHVTRHHSTCIIKRFRSLLKGQEQFLNDNGLHLIEGSLENVLSGVDRITETKDDMDHDEQDIPSIAIRYRHRRYITITMDVRTGRVKVRELGYKLGEGDAKLKELEERLNSDPENIARHLLWLRSEVVIREIVSLAKQLSLQPFSPSQMSLRPDDFIKLFGDLPTSHTPSEPATSTTSATTAAQPTTTTTTAAATAAASRRPALYPSHCVFLQFVQFEDWYLVIAIVRNEVYSWLCCINKTYDQNGLFQVIVDMMHVEYEEMWKEHFLPKLDEDTDRDTSSKRRRSSVEQEQDTQSTSQHVTRKRRRTEASLEDTSQQESTTEIIDNLSVNLRFMAKLDSLCRACITNCKIELQLQRLRGSINFTPRPLLKSLPTAESQVLNHPAAKKMEVLCVPQRDLLKACVMRNVDESHPTANNREVPLHIRPWVEKMIPEMKNDVVMRASGWWACGRSECFVVIQEKFDWKNMPLPTHDIRDHISLDKVSNVLSFTYTDIDNCIDRFLVDWERIFMMSYLARQSSSKWMDRYKDQLKFESFDTHELRFTYAKNLSCSIRWDSPSRGRARQYVISLGMMENGEHPKPKDKESATSLHMYTQNPHWRVTPFLQDILNEKRDLVYLVQIMIQTLPFMACLEKLEVDIAQKGAIGDISIIPHAADSVRIVFSSTHALDIRFTDHKTLCISDVAFQHLFYSSLALANTQGKGVTATAKSTEASEIKKESNDDNEKEGTMKPIKVAQSFNFEPFTKFDELLESVDDWLFVDDNDDESKQDPWYSFMDEEEPTAVPFHHGLLCSASLCRRVIGQLGTLV